MLQPHVEYSTQFDLLLLKMNIIELGKMQYGIALKIRALGHLPSGGNAKFFGPSIIKGEK